jgi:hypothetical protein
MWHEEDHARVEDDHEVAQAKRQIDQLISSAMIIEKLVELAIMLAAEQS